MNSPLSDRISTRRAELRREPCVKKSELQSKAASCWCCSAWKERADSQKPPARFASELCRSASTTQLFKVEWEPPRVGCARRRTPSYRREPPREGENAAGGVSSLQTTQSTSLALFPRGQHHDHPAAPQPRPQKHTTEVKPVKERTPLCYQGTGFRERDAFWSWVGFSPPQPSSPPGRKLLVLTCRRCLSSSVASSCFPCFTSPSMSWIMQIRRW